MHIASLAPWLIVLIVMLAVSLLVEVLSALAVLPIILPLLAQIVKWIEFNSCCATCIISQLLPKIRLWTLWTLTIIIHMSSIDLHGVLLDGSYWLQPTVPDVPCYACQPLLLHAPHRLCFNIHGFYLQPSNTTRRGKSTWRLTWLVMIWCFYELIEAMFVSV